MRGVRTFAMAAALGAALAAPASAQSRIQAGVLECLGLGTTGFIIGSVHDLECVFHSDYGVIVRCHGLVRKFGLDLGYTEHSGLTWAVFAPTRRSVRAILPATISASAPGPRSGSGWAPMR